MSARSKHNVQNVERAMEAFLREHPDALVCGLQSDGLIVPVPQSVGLWGQGAIEGRSVTDVVLAEDRLTVVEAWRRVLDVGTAEARVRLLSKPSHWATLYFIDIREVHGIVLAGLLPDTVEAANGTDEQPGDFEKLVPRSCWITEAGDGIVLDIDDAFTDMLGYGPEDVIGKPILDQVHPDDQTITVEYWIAMLSTHRPQRFRSRRRRKDGQYVWLEITLHNHLNNPERQHVLLEMVDVSAEMAAIEELQAKSELLRRVVEGSPDGLLQVDRERNVVYYNSQLLEMLNGGLSVGAGSTASRSVPSVTAQSKHGSSLRELLGSLSEESIKSFEETLERALGGGEDLTAEVDVGVRTGGWRRAQTEIRVLRDGAREVSGAIISFFDGGGARRSASTPEPRPSLDPLTRCQPRDSILAELQRELERRDSSCTALIYVDVDDLRSVNEALGHSAGDELLALTAERLRNAAREQDVIGRLGGDDFLVLLPDAGTPAAAEGVARRIASSLGVKAELLGGSVTPRASLGLAFFDGESLSAKEAVKRARNAMAASKRRQGADVVSCWEQAAGRRGVIRALERAMRRSGYRGSRRARGRIEIVASAAPDAREIDRRLSQHARQHDAVAQLGQLALREHDQGVLLDEAVAAVAKSLDVELCTVLRLRDNGQALDMIASVGYSHGPSVVPAGARTQAGYTLNMRSAVAVADLRSETRFDPTLLLEQGMLSGITAIIEGPEQPFGILSAHSSRRRSFSRDDINFMVAIANVISAAAERERKEDSAKHAALHDNLTGFPNRTLALDRIDRALARRRRDGIDVTVLLLDIDRFKLINDSLGHGAGDQVLVALAARLDETLRPSDTIARLGGDEFLVVSESEDGPRNAVELAERLGSAIRRPLPLGEAEHQLSASIGIAVADGGDDTAASLLRDADAAVHRAKEAGRGRYELFDATIRDQLVTRLRTENELRHALDRGQLEVHYQPIIDTASGIPVAAEALVRWRHPEHGLVPPLEFIPIAEETGLIGELGLHVLEQASAQCALWQQRYATPLRIYVNVSGAQLADIKFPAQAVEIARRSRLLPNTLGLEVTESVLIDGTKSSLDVLRELDAHGLPLVLDDFGTGYSSLSYLRRFPLSAVKVDRSFIDGLGTNTQDAAIMRAIVEMCRALGFSVVGEGVETDAQLRELQKLGCDHAQGYLLCHPMPVEEVTEFLDRRFAAGAIDRAA